MKSLAQHLAHDEGSLNLFKNERMAPTPGRHSAGADRQVGFSSFLDVI